MRSSSENGEELSKIDNIIQAFLGSFPNSWRSPQLEGEYLLDPTTLALAHRSVKALLPPLPKALQISRLKRNEGKNIKGAAMGKY